MKTPPKKAKAESLGGSPLSVKKKPLSFLSSFLFHIIIRLSFLSFLMSHEQYCQSLCFLFLSQSILLEVLSFPFSFIVLLDLGSSRLGD